jgi:ferrous iron transport protein B
VLASFPKGEQAEVNIKDSYVGYIGQAIEPVIEPMGFDWKIGIGLITSFAARETFVSTMSTIYGIEDDDHNSLKTNISKDYNLLIAISVMVFYVYAAQCMSTFAIVRRETNTWKWPIFMIVYMTALAYIGAMLVYQVGSAMGYA